MFENQVDLFRNQKKKECNPKLQGDFGGLGRPQGQDAAKLKNLAPGCAQDGQVET